MLPDSCTSLPDRRRCIADIAPAGAAAGSSAGGASSAAAGAADGSSRCSRSVLSRGTLTVAPPSLPVTPSAASAVTASFLPAPTSIMPAGWPLRICVALVIAFTVTSAGHSCGSAMTSSSVAARSSGENNRASQSNPRIFMPARWRISPPRSAAKSGPSRMRRTRPVNH